MTRNQFLKATGLKGLHKSKIKRYLDIVRQYKGKLSYLQFYVIGEICFNHRKYKLSDIKGVINKLIETKEFKDLNSMKSWKCENGKIYIFPKNHCVFCEYCTDIYYDDTHGPYMTLCDKRIRPTVNCPHFRRLSLC